MRTAIHTPHHHAVPHHLTLAALPAKGTQRRPRRLAAAGPAIAPRTPEPCPLSQAELRALILETMG